MLVAFSVAPSMSASVSSSMSSSMSSDSTGSVSAAVAAAVTVVRESGLPHRTSSMFTEVEGEWDEVMAVVKGAVDAVAVFGPRVSLVLKADIREGYSGELTAKLDRLEAAIDAGRGAEPGHGD